MSIAQAASALNIPGSLIHLSGRGHETLEVFKENANGFGRFLGKIYFWNNSAIGLLAGQEGA
jgi:hypothetical protein